jgi:phosphoribosyl-dephospho-CoA transferase
MVWLAHDLLRISDAGGVVCVGEQRCPLWVMDSLTNAPFVVVRRSDSIDNLIPVGVRGSSRVQRFPAYLAAESILERIAPEQLTAWHGRLHSTRNQIIPSLNAWDEVKKKLFNFSLVYGPTGSVGFELVSGCPAATVTSDLDLLFRVPERLPITAARELMGILAESACHIDAQLETPRGAVSLAEYARDQTPMLLKQNCGPVLVDDPWGSPTQ